MHKRIAIIAVVVALAAGSLVSAGSRSKAPTPRKGGTTVTDAGRGSLTIQRLLEARVDWIRQLSRSLRTLDGPPAELQGSGNRTLTIIDEPDPTGYLPKPPGEGDGDETPPGEEDIPRDSQRQPTQALG